MKIPNAAKMLVRQVQNEYPDTEVTPSEVDGYRIARVVTFSGDAEEWLEKAQPALDFDKRVVETWRDDEGFHVRFVGDIRADHKLPHFPLSEVAAIEPLEEGEEEEYATLDEDELRNTPVAQLREIFPEYADNTKKDLIAAVLADQG